MSSELSNGSIRTASLKVGSMFRRCGLSKEVRRNGLRGKRRNRFAPAICQIAAISRRIAAMMIRPIAATISPIAAIRQIVATSKGGTPKPCFPA